MPVCTYEPNLKHGLVGIANILFFERDVAIHSCKSLMVWKSGCTHYPNETIPIVYNVHDIDVLSVL